MYPTLDVAARFAPASRAASPDKLYGRLVPADEAQTMSLWLTVDKKVKAGDIAGAIARLEKQIRSSGAEEFFCLLGAAVSNDPEQDLARINEFMDACASRFDVRSVYLEMNGFDLNYDRWYFDLFAYSNYSDDPDDVDWLSQWQSPDWPQVELTGMAASQALFAWYQEKRIWQTRPELKPVYEAALLLVACQFMAYIGSVVMSGKVRGGIPVLATAHDFDILARYV